MQRRVFHVLHLSTVHPANDVRLLGKEAAALAAAGHHVELWGRHHRSEIHSGVMIHPLPPITFRLQRMIWLPIVVLAASLRRRADFHHLHDPELLPIGMLLAFTGRRVIYDIHENVPGSIMTKHWIPPLLRRLTASAADILERAAMQLLAGFVPATPAIARRFPPKRTQVVQNFPRLEEFSEYSGVRAPSAQEAVFAYVGVLTEPRGALQMLDALALTPDHYRLVIMGGVVPAELFDRMTIHRAWSRVTFLGQRPRTEAMKLLMHAHAGLVLFHPEPNHVESQPNKLFEYMAAGLPVIASDFPLWRELIGGQACGLLVNPLDAVAIAQAMTDIIGNPAEATSMGNRGRTAVYEHLNWSNEASKLLQFYSQLALENDHSIL